MQVVGIIAEYNPLHNGHIYHIEKARSLSHADYCVVVMSGNFVQRGEPACTDKYTRTRWALQAGADLVLELPILYANASAERFAVGGVCTLAGTGIITHLAFGCEDSDIQTLYQLAEIISSEPAGYRDALHRHLSAGKSYPRARADALHDYGVPEEMILALAKPNNILAVEYLNAIKRYAPGIQPVAVTRIGGGYASENLTGDFSSATAIRNALKTGNSSVLSALPSYVGGALVYDDQFPITLDCFSSMILYALRNMSQHDMASLPDVSEGIENVIYRTVPKSETLGVLLEEVKSKRYTMARLKRICINALLGITSDQVQSLVSSKEKSYLHILGYSSRAKGLLSALGKSASLPLILRNSDAMSCPSYIRASLETDALSTDLMSYASGIRMHRDAEGCITN
jgi:predicted nucleotidyltransferase